MNNGTSKCTYLSQLTTGDFFVMVPGTVYRAEAVFPGTARTRVIYTVEGSDCPRTEFVRPSLTTVERIDGWA